MAVTRDGILKTWKNAEELKAYLETPEGKAEMEKAITEVCENLAKLKKAQDEACTNGDHGMHLGNAWFSGGHIHSQCTHCHRVVSQESRPFTI